ncbi:hypothetical protein GAYE_SCF12G3312 [Galdieria yellowstonensis]|uniref:Importin N-terminal domain-containing protein n=1 Tax=Galdieria yellowstonensis TaxID=3028027 RepID=A0AAV9IDK1_9RHOD|nr:hypothetical protein GAYE_SCF12G3312 [Galdieria yellowstonensis]
MANGFEASTLSNLASYIDATLSPTASVRRNAEAFLQSNEKGPGFSLLLVELVSNSSFQFFTRQAAAVYLKNYVKRCWEDVDETEREKLKRTLTDNILYLPVQLRKLLTETVSVIADSDFPSNWEYLLPELCSKLEQTVNSFSQDHSSWSTCEGILEVVDALVECYRHLFRSDELLLELKYVLGQIQEPLLKTFRLVSENYLTPEFVKEDSNSTHTLLEIVYRCCRIFYSLCYQDLPEYFEDHMEEWAGGFLKILNISLSPASFSDSEESGSSLFDQVQAETLDNITLCAEKYEEEFRPYLSQFVSATWSLLIRHGNSTKYDQVVTAGMGLLTIVSKSVDFGLFSDPETLKQVCEYIIIPNVELREDDQDLFEENPMEYIRQDMEGSDAETRRRAVCELVRGLCTHYENAITDIFSNYVYNMLQEYAKDPMNKWKGKDAAIYLVTAIGWKGGTERVGATVVNQLVDLGHFYKNHIIPELESASTQPNNIRFPILTCDSIKFATSFRNQIPAELLPITLNFMSELLNSTIPVVHTYSCISIEKILALQDNGTWKVKKDDVSKLIPCLVHRLISFLMNVSSQNEYTAKCLMRVIIFFGPDVAPFLETLLDGIVKTLEMISQNPGNPNFIHYCFECIAGLTRYLCSKNPSSYLPILETKLFPFFQSVLTADIAEFVPYIFQILAQLAELHGEYEELSASYQSLLPVLFTPSLWNRSGYIPGMVRLLQAFVRKSMNQIIANNQLTPILGVFQNLVASKVHDYYGMSLIESIVETCDLSQLEPYLPEIVQIMLVRLQKGRTIRFTRAFIVFLSFLSIKFSSQMVISLLNRIQNGLFVQVFEHVWLPGVVQEANSKERKICATGLALYISCPSLIELPNLWISALSTVLSLLEGYQENPTVYTNQEIEESREYDIQFSQLALVGNRENIRLEKVPEPDQVLINNVTEVVANNPTLKNVIQSNLSDHLQQTLASYLQKFGRSI